MIVAIDGPAGAGKSTVARALAARAGIGYLDTGAMYRAVTHLALETGEPLDDAAAVARIARDADIHMLPGPRGLTVLAGGADVTAAIRSPEVTSAVSVVAAHAPVRDALVAQQRRILAAGDWVADGRDIGTVVAPGAEVKVFLTADPRVRAERRVGDLAALGRPADVAEVEADIARRDELDATRAVSPLRPAPDAVLVDSSGLSVDDVVDRIAALIAAAGAGAA